MITVAEKDFATVRKRNKLEPEADSDGIVLRIENKSPVKNNSNLISDNHEFNKKPSILTMKDEWTTYSSIGVQRKILKQNTKIIKNFINSLALPSWYRGVSVFQKKSAEQLLHAIRDDCAQRTVYRTMRCLDSIGLDPLPSKKQLHTILPLCGGSDLALLWFLMEWLYRDNESDSYSVNEQLIMSSIAHLDMNTTLRALDRILPPGHAPKTEMFQRSRKNLPKRKNNVNRNSGNILPYFEKLDRPISRKSSYSAREPNRKANMHCYQHQFFDTSRMMTNESHRWFQTYNINDNGTTVDNIAKEKISGLLNNCEATMLDENKVQTVYRQHENIDYLKNSFDSQLNTIAKRKFQEMAQIFGRKDQSHKRIINRLQSDVEKYRREFHTMAENCHKHCDLKLSTNSFRGNKVNNMDSRLHSNHNQGNIRSTCSSITMGYDRYSPTQRSRVIEFPDKNDFSSKTSENDTDSKYCCISQDFPPFKFDYCKIFAQKDNQSEFINFEDSDISVLNQLRRHSSSDGVDDAASNCILQIWQQELRQHEVVEFNSNAKDNIQINKVDYGLDNYDPEDDELMDRMLKDALDIMRKDHKYVFASMPAAHRFPLLREWIRLRYGKKYKKDETIRSFQQSLPIFSALAKVGLPVEMPSNADMGTDLITVYSCRDYVLRKSNYIRNEYYRRIDKAMLAQSRVIYFAMRPVLCCNGSPSNTIFAYMPAHKRKNYHFRPWKPEECMKRKQVNHFQTWMSHSLKNSNIGPKIVNKRKY